MIRHRDTLARAKRLVVKVGSSSLTTPEGLLDTEKLGILVDAVGRRWLEGTQVLLVTSGAIAAGLAPLGLKSRPRDLATQQAAASVGQGLLLQHYSTAFSSLGVRVGQVLLTVPDIARQDTYQNAFRTLGRLLRLDTLPIINENDTVATHEIRFGDNDRLAALVAGLIRADGLVIISDVDALYTAHPDEPGARQIADVADIDALQVDTHRKGTAVGTGGMITKLEAARIATAAGMPALIGSLENVEELMSTARTGTMFAPIDKKRPRRLLWLAHVSTRRGQLHVDAGAVRAVTERGASLLPAGITAVEGDFLPGEPVDIVGPDGVSVARGLVGFSSPELQVMIGRNTVDLAENLGAGYAKVVVHRDVMVLLGRGHGLRSTVSPSSPQTPSEPDRAAGQAVQGSGTAS